MKGSHFTETTANGHLAPAEVAAIHEAMDRPVTRAILERLPEGSKPSIHLQPKIEAPDLKPGFSAAGETFPSTNAIILATDRGRGSSARSGVLAGNTVSRQPERRPQKPSE